MPVELTDPIRSALDAAGTPLQVVDTRTNATYVLISATVFKRVRAILDDADDGPNDRAVARVIHDNMAEDDANDPLRESYQNYRA